MNINVKVGDFRTEAVDAIVFGIIEGETSLDGAPQIADAAMSGAISELLQAGDFEGETQSNECTLHKGRHRRAADWVSRSRQIGGVQSGKSAPSGGQNSAVNSRFRREDFRSSITF